MFFILLTCCQYRFKKRKNHHRCGGFLFSVYCILVTYGLRRKNKVTTTLGRQQSSMSRIHTLSREPPRQNFCRNSRRTKIGPVIEGHVVLTMGTHGLEIEVPSKRDHVTTFWVLIARGKNRFGRGAYSECELLCHHAESLSERSCSKDTEPCDVTDTRSWELEGNPSRVRRLASNPVTLTAGPVCFTKGTIPALERKWRNHSSLLYVCRKNPFDRHLKNGYKTGTSFRSR